MAKNGQQCPRCKVPLESKICNCTAKKAAWLCRTCNDRFDNKLGKHICLRNNR